MSYGVAEAARLLDVSKTTVHRWSTWFAEHLSDQASPEAGQPRRFTEADIATLRRAQRRLARGDTWELVAERLAIVEPEDTEPEEPAEPEEAPAAHEAPTAGPEEAEERAQGTTASQALAILSQQSQIIEAQAGQLKAAQAQLTDQGARLREQAGQLTDQGATIADLRERLARLEEAQRAQLEAQRQQERRRFRWPWEPREG